MKIIALTTLYNAAAYLQRCLLSIQLQSYRNFLCYITDDLSTDNSLEIAARFMFEDQRFIPIRNTEKLYQPGNYDQIIRNNILINDMDICIEVDGDDWLPDAFTFERIYNLYRNPNIWIANGSFIYHDGRPGFARPQSDVYNLRSSDFTASHIRTWRAFLWRNIKQQDLKDPEGNYWKVAGDLSFMYPMLEMAGKEHYCFMPDINYIYNEANPINDHKVDLSRVHKTATTIRQMPSYKRLISG